KVAKSRGRSFEEIHAVAQGRVWTGRAALAVGLVDKLGGLKEAIELAKEKAKLDKGAEVELVILPERKGLLETLFDDDEAMVEARLPVGVRSLLLWARAAKADLPSARLPFDLKIR